MDQQSIDVEHIVVDGGSSDGTVEWLRRQHDLEFISEADNGMYDAINKGLHMSSGDIVSYLNCDEQYLPGVLCSVAECFARDSSTDVVFGDVLIVDPDGRLIAYRKSHTPRRAYIWSSYLYTLSCAMFVRRRVIEDGFGYDTRYSAVADADFVLRLLHAKYAFRHLKEYLAVFTVTGGNKIRESTSIDELESLRSRAPAWVKVLRPLLLMARLSEKAVSGAYRQATPLSYSIYDADDLDNRTTYLIENPSYRLRW